MSDFKEYTDKFVTEVANVASYIGNKTGQFVDKTKIRITLSNQEAMVNNLYKKLGKYYYERYQQGTVDESMLETCKTIEMYLKTINAIKEDLNEK